MGKKDKKVEDATNSVNPVAKETKKAGIDGGITFDSSDAIIDEAQKQVNLPHVTKTWTRDAWERARPFVLEQRQKLETNGWTNVDGLRTEMFVLKKPAPQGSFTEDGSIYIRVPKKFIDFTRSGKGAGGEEGAAALEEAGGDAGEEGDKKKKRTSRISKKKEGAPSYELIDPLVWKLKIDAAESEEPGREPNVCLDVLEPMENILYLVMTLQPGLIKLYANRKEVVQAGTKQSSTRDDAEKPTVRHTAMVASTESYTRSLPPAFWFKRNAEQLRKIMSPTGNAEVCKEFDDTADAAENVQRAVTRTVKDVKEKTWEEELSGAHAAKAAKEAKEAKEAAAAGGMGAPAASPTSPKAAKKTKKVSKEVAATA